MAGLSIRRAHPQVRELPGLARLAIRVAASKLGGPPTAGTMCVVVNPDGLVAFVRASYRKDWSMPGGYADSGEAPILACAREVKEETGLVLRTKPRLLLTREFSYRRDFFYIAGADPADGGEPSTAWEIAEFVWATWESRPPLDSACAFLTNAYTEGVARAIAVELATLRAALD